MIANVWIVITISLGYSNIFKILFCLDFEYLIEFIWASLLPAVTLIFKILLAISSNLQNRSLILGILIWINMYVGDFHGAICLGLYMLNKYFEILHFSSCINVTCCVSVLMFVSLFEHVYDCMYQRLAVM